MLGTTLSIVIPAVVIGYGIWLAVRMIRNRNKSCGCGGSCSGCPYAGDCHPAVDCKLEDKKKARTERKK